jgi:hypothetical protein
MKMNRKTRSAEGASAAITLKARIMGVKAQGLDCPLALTNLKEVKK